MVTVGTAGALVAEAVGAMFSPCRLRGDRSVRRSRWGRRSPGVWWIYIGGPVMGAVVSAALWTYVRAWGDKDVLAAGGPLRPVPAQEAKSRSNGWRSEGERREGVDVAGQAGRAGGERP